MFENLCLLIYSFEAARVHVYVSRCFFKGLKAANINYLAKISLLLTPEGDFEFKNWKSRKVLKLYG